MPETDYALASGMGQGLAQVLDFGAMSDRLYTRASEAAKLNAELAREQAATVEAQGKAVAEGMKQYAAPEFSAAAEHYTDAAQQYYARANAFTNQLQSDPVARGAIMVWNQGRALSPAQQQRFREINEEYAALKVMAGQADRNQKLIEAGRAAEAAGTQAYGPGYDAILALGGAGAFSQPPGSVYVARPNDLTETRRGQALAEAETPATTTQQSVGGNIETTTKKVNTLAEATAIAETTYNQYKAYNDKRVRELAKEHNITFDEAKEAWIQEDAQHYLIEDVKVTGAVNPWAMQARRQEDALRLVAAKGKLEVQGADAVQPARTPMSNPAFYTPNDVYDKYVRELKAGKLITATDPFFSEWGLQDLGGIAVTLKGAPPVLDFTAGTINMAEGKFYNTGGANRASGQVRVGSIINVPMFKNNKGSYIPAPAELADKATHVRTYIRGVTHQAAAWRRIPKKDVEKKGFLQAELAAARENLGAEAAAAAHPNPDGSWEFPTSVDEVTLLIPYNNQLGLGANPLGDETYTKPTKMKLSNAAQGASGTGKTGSGGIWGPQTPTAPASGGAPSVDNDLDSDL